VRTAPAFLRVVIQTLEFGVYVGPRLRPGSIVVFDEYFNYPGWEEHEHRAWMEYVELEGLRFGYEGYTVDHEQVVVRVTAT
jgi:hypothetical protein